MLMIGANAGVVGMTKGTSLLVNIVTIVWPWLFLLVSTVKQRALAS
jgi:hypothetical protein